MTEKFAAFFFLLRREKLGLISLPISCWNDSKVLRFKQTFFPAKKLELAGAQDTNPALLTLDLPRLQVAVVDGLQ